MTVCLAGSTGGLVGLSKNDQSSLISLFSGEKSFHEFRDWFIKRQTCKVVSLVTNNNCNLKCRHCYLQVKELTQAELTVAQWEKTINSIAGLKPGLICISGKEVFVDQKGPKLLQMMKTAKDRNGGASLIGFITNGTLLHKHHQTVISMDPDYLDISLDGMQKDHDAIRGVGAYAKTIPNAIWAAETFKKRFYTSLTINALNVSRFIETVDDLQKKGISNIAAVFYKPQPYSDALLTLSQEQIDDLFTSLDRLGAINPEKEFKVMLDLDTFHLPSLQSFLKSKWFDFYDLKEDENANIYIEHYPRKNIRLLFRLHIIPGIERCRLTPEGNLLAAGDTLDARKYAECTIGNIRDFDYDFPALFDHSLHSDRFNIILKRYYQTTLPFLIKGMKNSISNKKGTKDDAA